MSYKGIGFTVLFVAILFAAELSHVISPDSLVLLVVLVPSIILHEVSHGFVALLFGDETARRAGRLTLNPFAHIDPVGSVLLPALLIFAGLTPIGYAKPVPVNVSRLRSPRNQSVLVSLAGPAVNFILAVIAGLMLHFKLSHELSQVGVYSASQITIDPSLVDRILFYMGSINLLLGVFNMIPIPPLDGSALIERLLPAGALPGYFRLRGVMLPVVLLLFLFFPGALARVFTPIIDLWSRVFVP
ncbi:MAG: site-2 protease family protein [Actinomycetota bacterium]|nr:MAG: site-2 protease family protein [Actinomycetota bacterium]